MGSSYRDGRKTSSRMFLFEGLLMFYMRLSLVKRMLAALRAVSVDHEPNPAKISWKC